MILDSKVTLIFADFMGTLMPTPPPSWAVKLWQLLAHLVAASSVSAARIVKIETALTALAAASATTPTAATEPASIAAPSKTAVTPPASGNKAPGIEELRVEVFSLTKNVIILKNELHIHHRRALNFFFIHLALATVIIIIGAVVLHKLP